MTSDTERESDRDWDRLRQVNWNEEAKSLLKAALKATKSLVQIIRGATIENGN